MPKGAATHEIQSNISAPSQLRIEKRGNYVYMWLGARGEKLRPAGAAIRVSLQGSFYVGIGVCSHDKDAVTKAVFSKVELKPLAAVKSSEKPTLYSSLETINIASTDRRVVHSIAGHF